MPVVVPPIKCQGIKTKLVPHLSPLVPAAITGRYIEPFLGSGVTAFNLRPERAILSDTNRHIIGLYQAIQQETICSERVREYLCSEGEILRETGESHYYAVRERFNTTHSPLDFLFLNRSCFNGVMRFNRRGGFNTPFCRKPERFAPGYITKIVNQVHAVATIIRDHDWTFTVSDFRQTLSQLTEADFVYADPPYAGRHTDYFNTWSDTDEADLCATLQSLSCPFVLSTWKENTFRKNESVETHWQKEPFHIHTVAHFYHVGSSETLRHPMQEALITNTRMVAEPTAAP